MVASPTGFGPENDCAGEVVGWIILKCILDRMG
jgi:hypothetical protein